MAVGSHRPALVIGLLLVAALATGVGIGFLLDNDEGVSPVQSQPDVPEQPGPGPTEEINGVPVGYARTEEGAVSAATNFHLLGAKDALLDPDSLAEAMQIFAAPSWDDEAATQATNGYEYIARTYGSDADLSTAVLRYSVDEFSPDRARVRLWTVSLGSGSKRPSVEEVWAVVTVDLVWVDEDWRVNGLESSVGPAPVLIPSNQPSRSAGTLMKDFDELEGAQHP